MNRKETLVLVAALALLLALSVASVTHGSTELPWREVLGAVVGPLGPSLGLPEVPAAVSRIVIDLRMPRVLLAAMVGAGLAVVGALLQTATRNDLADPFLFGLSSGASAGAVAAITVSGEFLGLWTLPAASLLGGLLAAGVVLTILRQVGNSQPEKMILAGLASSFLFSAATNYMVFAGDQRAAQSVLFWNLGGLGSARWDNLVLALFGLMLLWGFALKKHRYLDALLSGDDIAHTLGARPERLRAWTFGLCAIATGCFVALTGVIGFIGLMVPHLVRSVFGPLHKKLVAVCALFGATLLVASDLASRTLLAPQELPVGIITGGLGGLFVLRLLLSKTSPH
jgi:iron complex transport system permease protein